MTPRGVARLLLLVGLPSAGLAMPLAPGGFVTEWRRADGLVWSEPGPAITVPTLKPPSRGRAPRAATTITTELTTTPGAYAFRLSCDGTCVLHVDGRVVLMRDAPYGFWLDDREVTVTLGTAASVALDVTPPKSGPNRAALRVVPPVNGRVQSALPTDTADALAARLPLRLDVTARGGVVTASAIVGPAAAGLAAITVRLLGQSRITTGSGAVSLSGVVPGDGSVEVAMSIEAAGPEGARVIRRETRRVRVDRAALIAMKRAESASRVGAEPDAVASLQWWQDNVERLLVRDEKDATVISDGVRQLEAATADLDPSRFAARTGIVIRAYTSPLDGRPQPYALYVPPAPRGLPLIVALHPSGYTPLRTLRAAMGLGSIKGDTRVRLSRVIPRAPASFPAVVVAPWGYDGTGSRYFGKVDVLDVMDRVASRYRTHPGKVVLTGGSLGGLGTWHLGLRMPDRFAALMPVAGYGSVRQYPTVAGKRLLPWEKYLVDRRDNVSFVSNARQLPMHCVHGARDNPKRSTVIVDRYRALGYTCQYDEIPGVGHAVWDVAYAGGAALALARQAERPTSPDRVDFVSGSYRHRRAYWVTIEQSARSDRLANVHAIRRQDRVEVTTDNVARVTLDLGPRPRRVVIDNVSLGVASGITHWTAGAKACRVDAAAPPVGEKRPGLSGPIDDIRYEPHVFVYGTAAAEETETDRALAEYLARYPKADADITMPVVADTDVDDALMASHHLVLIGTRRGNRVLARIADRLPIRVMDDSIALGDRRFAGPSVGADFIAPNPLAPAKYVRVLTGLTRRGVWLTSWLPEWLPDYVIFDEGVAVDRGGYVMDGRRPLAAGYFDLRWRP